MADMLPLRHVLLVLIGIAGLCPADAQLKIQKVREPVGKRLEKAFHSSVLTQPGAQPFHVRLEISATNGSTEPYTAVIEETWISNARWRRTVSAPGLTQTIVMNETGLHVVSQGDYMPLWLRSFVQALVDPIPDPEPWGLKDAMVEYIILPNGTKSTPCQHAEFMLGTPELQQVNFANLCFQTKGELLDFFGWPGSAMEFHDYTPFGKLQVARRLVSNPVHGVTLTGVVTTLEPAQNTDATAFGAPEGAGARDPLQSVVVGTATMKQLASDKLVLHWPSPVPGHGVFTVWVSLDQNGKVRETHPLNSDESGIAADMAAQLVGQQWKGAVKDGSPVAAEGALIFSYPAASATPPAP